MFGVISIEFVCHDRHLVLRECSGLVRANHGGGAHRFASVQLSHKIVLFQHLTHAESQTDGDAHRKSFGNGNDNQGDGKHDGT